MLVTNAFNARPALRVRLSLALCQLFFGEIERRLLSFFFFSLFFNFIHGLDPILMLNEFGLRSDENARNALVMLIVTEALLR